MPTSHPARSPSFGPRCGTSFGVPVRREREPRQVKERGAARRRHTAQRRRRARGRGAVRRDAYAGCAAASSVCRFPSCGRARRRFPGSRGARHRARSCGSVWRPEGTRERRRATRSKRWGSSSFSLALPSSSASDAPRNKTQPGVVDRAAEDAPFAADANGVVLAPSGAGAGGAVAFGGAWRGSDAWRVLALETRGGAKYAPR